MLSEKFQNYQNSLKECFYHKDSTNSDSQEYREILGVVLEDRDLERDIATFSQIGNIEIKLTKKAEFDYNEYNANSQDDEVNRKKSKRDGYTEFKRTIRLIDMEKYILNENGSADIHKLDCGDQSVDSNIIEKIIDSSTSNNENSENVSMTPTTHRSGYSTKEYLDQVWWDQYAFELYTIELNRLWEVYNLKFDDMLNISYKCTADLDTIETYLKNPRAPSIKGRVWSKLEDLTLQNIMNGLKQSLAEGHDEANLIPETDNYHTIEFEVLKRLKGIEQIKRRCDFLGLDFGYITIVKNYNH